ncbi:hypothetical protein [Sphingomonas sp. PAMC 26621]|nr:hypothetical protein [Sphingomonas sp. PAMC 26621]
MNPQSSQRMLSAALRCVGSDATRDAVLAVAVVPFAGTMTPAMPGL